MTGKRLYDLLLKKYHLQLEMAAETYALAMFTVNDTEEGYGRMLAALLQINDALDAGETGEVIDGGYPGYPPQVDPGDQISLARAWDRKKRYVPLEESAGCRAGEFVNLYPPGVPLLVPGERIVPQLAEDLRRCLEMGLKMQGLEVEENTIRISVLEDGT